jgi:hypothetical protein
MSATGIAVYMPLGTPACSHPIALNNPKSAAFVKSRCNSHIHAIILGIWLGTMPTQE